VNDLRRISVTSVW